MNISKIQARNQIFNPLLQIRTRLWILQSMLNPLLESIGINLKDIVHLADSLRCESLLVNMDIAIIGASVGGIHIQEH